MLSLTRFHRCYLYEGRTDMRKGIDSLCGLIRNELGKDPLSGELFIFFCGARRRVKIVVWDTDGFALYHKRLERGTYQLPTGKNATHHSISAQQLNFILAGVELEQIKFRPRYQHIVDSFSVV